MTKRTYFWKSWDHVWHQHSVCWTAKREATDASELVFDCIKISSLIQDNLERIPAFIKVHSIILIPLYSYILSSADISRRIISYCIHFLPFLSSILPPTCILKSVSVPLLSSASLYSYTWVRTAHCEVIYM